MNEQVMLSLGSFKFTSATNLAKLSRSLDCGISFQERIGNHSAATVSKKWEESISLEGFTIPAQGAGLKALEPLFALAQKQEVASLTSSAMAYYGRFIIASVEEGREIFTPAGAFLQQPFSIELKRVEY